MKLKKSKKSARMRGSRTHGWAMKKHKGSGNRGGKGMAGTGKRADQKKTYVLRYHYPYFGKQGFTSRGTAKKKLKTINLSEIESNLQSFLSQGRAKKTSQGIELDLHEYKILGDGKINEKLLITVRAASVSAIAKIEKAGGKIMYKRVPQENAV